MARYFFHVRRGRLIILDHCGVELADLDEVTKEAVRRALEIEADAAVLLGNDAIIVDDDFSRLFEVPLTNS